MKRILLTSAAIAVAGSTAFAGGVAPVMVEPQPTVIPAANPGSALGGAALPLIIGGTVAVAGLAAVLSDDDDDDASGTTTN